MPSKVLNLAKSRQFPTWWLGVECEVKWEAVRHPDLPVLEATGKILLWPEDDDEGDEYPSVEAGTISVAKPYLWAGDDALIAMDDISADYSELASAVLDGRCYSDDFTEGYCETYGEPPIADPVFVHDLDIEPRYRNPREPLAAVAVLEAAAAFGAPLSPLIGFGPSLVADDLRDRLRDRGLFDWTTALGAKEFRGVFVAPRPAG